MCAELKDNWKKTRNKTKLLSSLESVKAVLWVGEDLWWEGFVEKVRFECGVEESGSDGW